jgi:hypothetical protein
LNSRSAVSPWTSLRTDPDPDQSAATVDALSMTARVVTMNTRMIAGGDNGVSG